MSSGSRLNKGLLQDLADKSFRDAFAADQVRVRIALMIRALREARGLSQAELGALMGKPQNVVSRLEDPDYGKMSLQSLIDVSAALDVPLWIDFADWDDWLKRISDTPAAGIDRAAFSAETVIGKLKPHPKKAVSV